MFIFANGSMQERKEFFIEAFERVGLHHRKFKGFIF
jgi:hypothetical protein